MCILFIIHHHFACGIFTCLPAWYSIKTESDDLISGKLNVMFYSNKLDQFRHGKIINNVI